MKAIKKLLAISTMFIVGGMVNAQATSFDFEGYANSMSWRQISGVKEKSSDTGTFGAKANLVGSSDTLKFLLEYEDGQNICSVIAIEGAANHSTCSYYKNDSSAIGTKVIPWVISESMSVVNFPISGNLDIY